MKKRYRTGMVNTCFLLPRSISAKLKKQAIEERITMQELLAFLVCPMGHYRKDAAVAGGPTGPAR